MDRCTADHIGMLATTMNALALQDGFTQIGVESRVQTGIEMRQIAEFYIRKRATRHLEKTRIVIFGCGTGSPFFSTDTAAALRAAEIEADAILLAKNIDGVYNADPRKDSDAKRYVSIAFNQVLTDRLQVMDSAATAMCMDNDIPVIVFALNEQESIMRVSSGEALGTLVKNDIDTVFYN